MRWTHQQQADIEGLAKRARDVDPIILQIVEGTLNSIEAEIEVAIERTARSPRRTTTGSGCSTDLRGNSPGGPIRRSPTR